MTEKKYSEFKKKFRPGTVWNCKVITLEKKMDLGDVEIAQVSPTGFGISELSGVVSWVDFPDISDVCYISGNTFRYKDHALLVTYALKSEAEVVGD